jgi:hypothetical protein
MHFVKSAGVIPECYPDYPVAYDAGKRWRPWRAQGEWGFGAQWAGEGVAMIRALPAADLMQALIREGGFCTQPPRRDGDLPRLLMSDRADV